jgi:glycosyltransferase involved in cell wall biosynthesis
MRLLHVADRFGWSAGGGDRYLEENLAPLRQRGVDNVVVYRDGNPARLATAERAIEIAGLMQFTGQVPQALARLEQVIRDTRPDAALVYCLPNPGFGMALVDAVPTILVAQDYGAVCPAATQWWRLQDTACDRTVGLPCLVNAYTKGCYTRRPGPLVSAYRHVIESRAWLRRTHILAISAFVKGRFVAAGYRDGQIHVLRYPFALEAAMPPPPDELVEPTVLFVGRVSREKGMPHLLQALARVPHRRWRLLVAGDGPDLPDCRLLASRLGLDGRVEFAGWLSGGALEAAFAASALVVVPSLWPEPYGQVGPQAMMRGRPVVAYASGAIPEWLSDGETGLSVAPGDITGLSMALEELLADARRRAAMGRRAREWVLEALTLDRHLSGLELIIAHAMRTHSLYRPTVRKYEAERCL